SEPGHGTTFKIYLPRAGDELAPGSAPLPAGQVQGGCETILVVEDEEIVRTLACEILRHHGYRVLVAAHGVEALNTCSDADVKIDLMLTDLIMPHMGGRELAERAGRLRPDLKILFTSGYTDDAIFHRAALEPGRAFIEKPFAPDALARKIRRVLDQSPPRSEKHTDHDVESPSPLVRDPQL
ncbi:MAG TPA: response regulator, partial [Pyrinomonadaceae bacterium]|nr:response regulator [Pyrinomonadaceae bacterium]